MPALIDEDAWKKLEQEVEQEVANALEAAFARAASGRSTRQSPAGRRRSVITQMNSVTIATMAQSAPPSAVTRR